MDWLRRMLPVQLAPEEIRFLRLALGLKSKDMAEAIDIDPATWSRWEGGRVRLKDAATRRVSEE